MNKEKSFLFGSLARRNIKNIDDIDIIIQIPKPVSKYSSYVRNYNYKDSKILEQFYNKYKYCRNLAIDIFLTNDFVHYFQLLSNGDIMYWGDILKPKNITKINTENF